MPTLLLTAAILIVLTKFLDCWTTSRMMAHPQMEQNRWARKWMLKYGKEKVIWGVFAATVLITGISFWVVWGETVEIAYQLIFLVMAAVISTTQFFVALANYRRKQNWVTKLLMRWRPYS